jgi:hypothetical protein
MMRRLVLGFAFAVFGAGTPQTALSQARVPAEFASAVDDALLLRAFAALSADSMQGRRIATPGSEKARAYLVRELTRLGVEPLVPGFEASFTARVTTGLAPVEFGGIGQSQVRAAPGMTRVSTTASVIGRNVLGVVRGTEQPERFLVLSAHYDHIGIWDGRLYFGANDNASGSAALIAIAELLKAAPPKHSVILAWFDGEESALAGSKAFLRNPPVPLKQIAANVNLDVLGRDQDGGLYVVGDRAFPAFRPLIDSVAASGIMPVRAGHDGRDEREDYYRRSDQWAFYERGIPAVLLTTGAYDDLHQHTDTAQRAHLGAYVRAVSVVVDFLMRLDSSVDALFPPKR